MKIKRFNPLFIGVFERAFIGVFDFVDTYVGFLGANCYRQGKLILINRFERAVNLMQFFLFENLIKNYRFGKRDKTE